MSEKLIPKGGDFESHIEEELQGVVDGSLLRFPLQIFTVLDKVLGELKAIREEQIVHQGQHDDLTNRLERLEAIHLRGDVPE